VSVAGGARPDAHTRAQVGLEEPARAEREVRRHFARCLSCQLAEATARHPTPGDATAGPARRVR
jgi:hypothetical protein